MEVKINREIRNYTESMFFGLSMRQFVFSILACGVGVHPLPRDERRAVFVGVDQIGVPYPQTPAFQPREYLLRSGEAVH